MAPQLRHLDFSGRMIGYRLRHGDQPTLVFLPGYASDMEGTKALALDAFAKRKRLAMLRFDYSGTGSSSGKFDEATLELWLEDALAAIDRLTEGSVILVGSSMGGWIALHAALRRSRVRSVLGIAAAPDFTKWGFRDDQRAIAKQQGFVQEANPYGPRPTVFTRGFLESGDRLLVLEGDIALRCPVRLVHGERDEEVPLDVALRTMQALRSDDVQLKVIKGAGHRLSQPHEIGAILRSLSDLLERET